MGIHLATKMRLLAISNMVMVYVGLWTFISFPLPFSFRFFTLESFVLHFMLSILDFIITLLVLREFRAYITADIEMKTRILRWSWIIMSFVTRFLTIGYASFFITAAIFPILIPILIATTSFLFGLNLFYIRRTRVALKVKSLVLVMIIFNFGSALIGFSPVGLNFVVFSLEIGYLIALIVGGLLKAITYLVSGWVFLIWSGRIIKTQDEEQHLYPTEEKEDSELYPELPVQ